MRVSKTLRDNALHIPNRVLAKPCGSPESESLISRVELTGCAQRPRLVHPLARTSLPEDSRGFLEPARIRAIVAAVYPELHEGLVEVARRQVHAHLVKLEREGRVEGRTFTGPWQRTR